VIRFRILVDEAKRKLSECLMLWLQQKDRLKISKKFLANFGERRSAAWSSGSFVGDLEFDLGGFGCGVIGSHQIASHAVFPGCGSMRRLPGSRVTGVRRKSSGLAVCCCNPIPKKAVE